MAKITPLLWTHKADSEGRSPIYLRIANGQKTRYVSLRVKVLPSQWNDNKGEVRRSHKKSSGINKKLKRKVAELHEEIWRLELEGRQVTADRLKKKAKGESHSDRYRDFYSYADRIVAQFEQQGRIYAHKRYKSVFKKMRAGIRDGYLIRHRVRVRCADAEGGKAAACGSGAEGE